MHARQALSDLYDRALRALCGQVQGHAWPGGTAAHHAGFQPSEATRNVFLTQLRRRARLRRPRRTAIVIAFLAQTEGVAGLVPEHPQRYFFATAHAQVNGVEIPPDLVLRHSPDDSWPMICLAMSF